MLLQAKNISKSYPGVQALSDVSLALGAGEVLAVVGENGAGKSTLMKILAGVEQPGQGTLLWEGQPFSLSGVHAAEKKGIVLIHQELNLAENLDIAANIFLGREKTWGGPLRLLRRDVYPQAEKLLQRVGLDRPASTLVGSLSVGQQQLVEIARALLIQSRVLIMDEPTSSLTETETRTLFGVINDLKQQGVSILYISHRLKEIEQIADRAVVLRDGKNSGELQKADIKPDALIKLMVGRELKQLHQRHAGGKAPAIDGQGLLRLENLRWSHEQPAAGISLGVAAGEIVGLAGLVGAGRTELAEVLFGVRPLLGGSIRLCGKPYHPRDPRGAMRAGLFLVPEDRRLQGLLLGDSVRNNVCLATLEARQRFGLILQQAERTICQEKVKQLNIRTPTIGQTVGLLSGGNQQKVVLAKGLVREPRVLILDEPTRGVDVGAKAEIYAIMDQLARQGVAILMISSDLEEVLGMSDRIIVLHEGKQSGELSRDQYSEEEVMRLATGRSAA